MKLLSTLFVLFICTCCSTSTEKSFVTLEPENSWSFKYELTIKNSGDISNISLIENQNGNWKHIGSATDVKGNLSKFHFTVNEININTPYTITRNGNKYYLTGDLWDSRGIYLNQK